MNRRIAQFVSLVIAVTMVFAAIALAKKPPKPGDDPSSGIVATTTDEDFLSNVVDNISDQTTFNLAIDVSGKGTHYRYVIGPADTTDPSQLADVPLVAESEALAADISAEPDGTFVLYLQGLEIDRRGRIKNAQPLDGATTYMWFKDTNEVPTFTWIEPDGNGDAIDPGNPFTLKWEDADSDDNALIEFFFGDALPDNYIGMVDEDPDGDSDEMVWDTTGVAEGVYFLCARVTDSQTVRHIWSAHPVTIGTPTQGPWNWQPEKVVPVGSVRYRTYQVEMDGFGNAMAVGTYVDDRGWVLNYSVYNGNGWSDGVDIVTHQEELDTVPILKSTGPNRYLLVYIEDPIWPDLSVPAKIKSVFYDGTNWDPTHQHIDEIHDLGFDVTFYDGTTQSSVFNYGAACSANGTAMVVWREENGGTICTRFFNGELWESDVSHNPGILPAIAADDAGNYMIAYAHGDTNAADEGMLYFMHYDGSTWTAETQLNAHTNMIGRSDWYAGENGPVRLAGAGDNKFIAVYTSQTANIDLSSTDNFICENNLYGRYFNGSDWETEALLDNESGAITNGVIRLAMSISGSALVTWTQIESESPPYGEPSTTDHVLASCFDGSGNWAAVPTKLSYNTFGRASNEYGGLTIDALGDGIATFYDSPYPDCRSVVKVHHVAGSGWQLQAVDDPLNRPTDREALTGPGGYSTKNRLAGQADGRAILLFTDTNEFPINYFKSREYGD